MMPSHGRTEAICLFFLSFTISIWLCFLVMNAEFWSLFKIRFFLPMPLWTLQSSNVESHRTLSKPCAGIADKIKMQMRALNFIGFFSEFRGVNKTDLGLVHFRTSYSEK